MPHRIRDMIIANVLMVAAFILGPILGEYKWGFGVLGFSNLLWLYLYVGTYVMNDKAPAG